MRPAALLLALCATALALLVACAPAPPPPPPPVASNPVNPRVGVHTRLTDEPDPVNIDHTLDLVHRMGAGSIVEYFPWAYFQPAADTWDWQHADLVIDEAVRQGLRVYARIDMVPDWARPPGSPSRLLPPDQTAAYAAAVAQFAQRYGDRLAGIIVWNEPNISYEWGFQPVDPARYADLLKQTYRAVKAVSPTTRILLAGLAPTLDKSTDALDDLDFLQALYQDGAAPYFDAVAAHDYGWLDPPDAAPAPDKIDFRRLELLHQVMVANGDGAKPVVISETGWNDEPRWTKAVRWGDRIRYTLQAIQYAQDNWPWVESLNFWLFRLPRPAHNYNDGYAFVTPDFTLLPIYTVVQQYLLQQMGSSN